MKVGVVVVLILLSYCLCHLVLADEIFSAQLGTVALLNPSFIYFNISAWNFEAHLCFVLAFLLYLIKYRIFLKKFNRIYYFKLIF